MLEMALTAFIAVVELSLLTSFLIVAYLVTAIAINDWKDHYKTVREDKKFFQKIEEFRNEFS